MRDLTIECGAPAVRKYRFGNFIAQMPQYRYDRLVYNEDVSPTDQMRRIAAQMGATPEEVWLSDWAAAHPGPYDVVWTNDHREETVTLALHHQEQGARVIADVDDLFTDIPSGNIASIHWNLRKKRIYQELLERADLTTTSTPFLAEKFNGTVSENFVIPVEWSQPRREDKGYTLIACPAGSGRAEDYEGIEPALREALKLDDVRVLFCGWMPEWAFMDYKPGKVFCSQWVTLDRYPSIMRWLAPDIVISPLMHNDFNKAKSNLKWMEAAMMGAAFIGEDWGEYQRTGTNGVDCLLAEGDLWSEMLVELCQNKELRDRLVRTARNTVYRDWTWKEERNVLDDRSWAARAAV